MRYIHVQWDGPYSYKDAVQLKGNADYGVYQIYGSHPIYGSDVLLYIGKAEIQTFGKRLSQEIWDYHNQDSGRIAVYVGRIADYKAPPGEEEWNQAITVVERLLIYSHWPAGNSSGLNAAFGDELHNLHVLNWGAYRDLLPEVSGARYSSLFESNEGFAPYELAE